MGEAKRRRREWPPPRKKAARRTCGKVAGPGTSIDSNSTPDTRNQRGFASFNAEAAGLIDVHIIRRQHRVRWLLATSPAAVAFRVAHQGWREDSCAGAHLACLLCQQPFPQGQFPADFVMTLPIIRDGGPVGQLLAWGICAACSPRFPGEGDDLYHAALAAFGRFWGHARAVDRAAISPVGGRA
jgi:hypothetical protein